MQQTHLVLGRVRLVLCSAECLSAALLVVPEKLSVRVTRTVDLRVVRSAVHLLQPFVSDGYEVR
jgi:hypothetical protein